MLPWLVFALATGMLVVLGLVCALLLLRRPAPESKPPARPPAANGPDAPAG